MLGKLKTLLILFQWCLLDFSGLEDEKNYPLILNPQRTFKMKVQACKKTSNFSTAKEYRELIQVFHLQNEDHRYTAVMLR